MPLFVKKWQSQWHAALAVILLMAFVQRLYVFLVKLPTINSDEAIIGLMARHILTGERPFFYYGQSYYGPLDAYLAAPLFALWGSSDLTLRIVPFLGSLGFVVAIFFLGRQLYSERVGLVSALFAAICPVFLALRGLKGDAAYSLVLLLGTLSLLLFQNWMQHPTRIKLVGLVFLSLFGIWVFPLMVYYVFAMGLTWFLVAVSKKSRAPTDQATGAGLRSRPQSRSLIWILACILLTLGMIVVVRYSAFSALINTCLTDAGAMLSYALPVLWGFISPLENYPLFLQSISRIPAWGMTLIVVVSAILFAAGIVTAGRRFRGEAPLLFIFVTGSALIYLVFFVMIGIKIETLSSPRFLFPLYSSIPFWVNGWLQWTQKNHWMQMGMIAAVLAVNVYSTVSAPPVAGPTQDLLGWFTQNSAQGRVDGVYTGYWTGYWLAFESQERVIPFLIADGNRPGGNRYAPYGRQALAWRSPAFVYEAGSADEAALAAFLVQNRVQYKRTQVGTYTIYYDLSKLVACRENGLVLEPSLSHLIPVPLSAAGF